MTRRAFLGTAAVGGVALLAGCQAGPGAATATPAGSAAAATQSPEWAKLVADAKAEGVVSLAGPAGPTYRPAVADAFQKAYPGIEVQGVYANPADHVARIVAERTANRFSVDILINGTGPALNTFKPAGGLAPLKPQLILPEVLDEAAWVDKHLWWADGKEPYTTLMYQGSVQSVVAYNTTLVKPEDFSSYKDLLDPKWKGKIAATDVRNPGPGSVPVRFLLKHPDLGEPFLARLFGETAITLSSDQRQLIDWLAQGKYPLGVLLFAAEVSRAAEQGLPVAVIPDSRFKEGGVLGPAWGAVAIMDKAPHPNAAKLYVNWLLSKDGQKAWQDVSRETSLRTDIPKTGLLKFDAPQPGVKYVNGGVEEYIGIPGKTIADIITKAQSVSK